MKNICHFIASKGLGRGEFYIDLVNEMSMNMNDSITLLVPKKAKFISRVSNRVKVVEYSSKDSRFNPFLYLELYGFFKKNSFDVVHTHFAKSSEIFYNLNKLFNNLHIATKHNPRKGRIFNKIKYVTAVSNDVADSIQNENVHIIYNGINPLIIQDKSKNEKFTIRAVGRLDKIKGFDKLIKEFKNLNSDCLLEIIGDGEEYDDLSKLIIDLKLENKVKLLGFRKDIPSLISNADLVVMSSLSEGFSIVMIESIFYAKIFISTKVSGCKNLLPEKLLIKDFNISEKINDILANVDFYENEFLEVKKRYQDELLLNNVACKYLEYYKRIMQIENSNN